MFYEDKNAACFACGLFHIGKVTIEPTIALIPFHSGTLLPQKMVPLSRFSPKLPFYFQKIHICENGLSEANE